MIGLCCSLEEEISLRKSSAIRSIVNSCPLCILARGTFSDLFTGISYGLSLKPKPARS